MTTYTPSTPYSVLALLNYPSDRDHSHVVSLQLDGELSEISVRRVLQAAWRQFPDNVVSKVFELRLRWITDEFAAFRRPSEAEFPQVQRESRDWYATKGYRLQSTPMDDATLGENLEKIMSGNYVRIYVVALPARAPRLTTKVERLAARNQEVHAEVQNGSALMYSGRQPIANNNLGPSACLYHKAFAMLSHALADDKALCEVDLDQDITFALFKLRRELAQPTLVDEKTYMDVLEKYLPPLFPGTTFHRRYPIPNCDAVLDFAFTCTSPYGVEAVVVTGGVDFSECSGGSAITQALCGYRRVCIGIERDAIFSTSCCPCIVLVASGPTLRFRAAYFAGDVYSTPMDMGGLSLQFVPGVNNEYNTKLARRIQALRNTVKMLSRSYEENHTGAYRGPHHLLPKPVIVPKPGGAWTPAHVFPDFSLRFTDACITTHGRAVFKGEITLFDSNPDAPPVPVYIKFVRKYGVAAHEHLAKARFAPELRWYGKVYGGPMMVIMDEVEGLTIDEILAQRDEIPEGKEAPKVEDLVTKKDLDSLHEAVAAMRAGGFLHGDLRPPNVVLQEQPDGSRKAYIIDFDWAGVDGEARYPEVVLNPDLMWPRDPKTMPGTLILPSDDTKMRSTILIQPMTLREIVSTQPLSATSASSPSSSSSSAAPALASPAPAHRQGVALSSKRGSKRPMEESEPNLDVQPKKKRLIASAGI